MKLRNKKTGEIIDSINAQLMIITPSEIPIAYLSINELIENWEDVENDKPAYPLIEDEKARKVFREWADFFGAERFIVNHLYNSGNGKTTSIGSTDLTTEPVIELPDYIGKDFEIYTITELCGEDEE